MRWERGLAYLAQFLPKGPGVHGQLQDGVCLLHYYGCSDVAGPPASGGSMVSVDSRFAVIRQQAGWIWSDPVGFRNTAGMAAIICLCRCYVPLFQR